MLRDSTISGSDSGLARFWRTPWALLLPLLLPLPFMLSAAARALTGTSFGLGLILSLALLLALSLWIRIPSLGTDLPPAAVMVTFVSCAAYILWFGWLLYVPDFEGAPNTPVGVDSGNHIVVYHQFVAGATGLYEGFVSLYGLMYWFIRIFARHAPNSLAQFAALRAAYYLAVMIVPAALALATLATVRGQPPRPAAARVIIGTLTGAAALRWLLFPFLQYYQQEGFHSQVVGLYPLLMLWIFWGFTRDPRQRLVLLLFWLLTLRYTYALNLSDLLMAFAILYLQEKKDLPTRAWRIAATVFVVAGTLGAAFAAWRLFELRGMDGYFSWYAYGWLIPAEIIGGFALLVAPNLLPLVLHSPVDKVLTRLLRSAGLIALLNGMVYFAYLAAEQPVKYYFYKYNLVAIVMLILGWNTLIGFLIGELSEKRAWQQQPGGRLAVAGTALLALLLTVACRRGLAIYQPAGAERVSSEKPYHQLWPIFDPTADRFINKLVSTSGASFGGFYSTFWPRAFFMNTLHGQLLAGTYVEKDRRYHSQRNVFDLDPGRCFVWETPVSDYGYLPLSQQIQQLAALPNRECTSYQPKWTTERMTICGACL